MTIADQVPRGPDWIVKELAALRQRLQEVASANTLQAAAIGEGGITVQNGGGITVKTGGAITAQGTQAAGVTMETVTDPYWGDIGQLRFTGLDGTGNPFTEGLVRSDVAAVGVEMVSGVDLNAVPAGLSATVTAITGAGAPVVGLTAQVSDTNQTQVQIIPGGTQYGTWAFQGTDLVQESIGTTWRANTAPEWRAWGTYTSAYIPVRASSFPVSSSREVKEGIRAIPFDALEAVGAAEAFSWRYKPDHATDPLEHVSPMAEDLPAAMVHEVDGVKSVDTTTMNGVLWAAVRQLAGQVTELQERLDALTA